MQIRHFVRYFFENPQFCRGGRRKFWHIAQRFFRLAEAAPAHNHSGVINMNQKRHQQQRTEDLRLDPEARVCPVYDSVSIKKFCLPDAEMGVRVIDNCAEENMR